MPIFHPPTIRVQIVDNGLRYGMGVGVSVLRIGGKWLSQQNPTTEQIRAAERYYAGGHVYELSDDLAQELRNAGYTIADDDNGLGDAFLDLFTDTFGSPPTEGTGNSDSDDFAPDFINDF